MVAQGLSLDSRRLGEFPPLVADDARAGEAGTLLILVCGLHGNEPAGVHAARRVLRDLALMDVPFRGRLVALAGNMHALERGQRYIERDLNRVWTTDVIEAARRGAGDDLEGLELHGLIGELEPLLEKPRERVVLLDLHSTSADGSPFVVMGDSLQNRAVAVELGIPILLGLEERLGDTLLSYFSARGHISLCVEGGQSDLASTIDNHEAAIWLTLVSTGIVPEECVEGFAAHKQRLADTSWGLPDFIEVRHREELGDAGTFRMEPGYTNFHQITRGETLGWLTDGGVAKPVHTPIDGLLLMPRYQGQGDDAFFVGSGVRPGWLRLSAVLRRLRLDWMLPCLPAVTRAPRFSGGLRLDGSRVPRPWVIGLLHLFGYRRRSGMDNSALYIRRRDADS